MVKLLSRAREFFALSRSSPDQHPHFPESKTGIVTIMIQPNRVGQVRFQGAWWSACCLEPIQIQTDELVYITGQLSTTTLLVQPIATPSAKA